MYDDKFSLEVHFKKYFQSKCKPFGEKTEKWMCSCVCVGEGGGQNERLIRNIISINTVSFQISDTGEDNNKSLYFI